MSEEHFDPSKREFLKWGGAALATILTGGAPKIANAAKEAHAGPAPRQPKDNWTTKEQLEFYNKYYFFEVQESNRTKLLVVDHENGVFKMADLNQADIDLNAAIFSSCPDCVYNRELKREKVRQFEKEMIAQTKWDMSEIIGHIQVSKQRAMSYPAEGFFLFQAPEEKISKVKTPPKWGLGEIRNGKPYVTTFQNPFFQQSITRSYFEKLCFVEHFAGNICRQKNLPKCFDQNGIIVMTHDPFYSSKDIFHRDQSDGRYNRYDVTKNGDLFLDPQKNDISSKIPKSKYVKGTIFGNEKYIGALRQPFGQYKAHIEPDMSITFHQKNGKPLSENEYRKAIQQIGESPSQRAFSHKDAQVIKEKILQQEVFKIIS